ncbi:hypothetical protein [Lawsonia intracellularis]|uniref:NA n=1 Tax=Lawsonia intracellularis (strain PHE/MN1-00) TaxID=363253 RepID=Q1MPI1_LAWIP|nr:hypothetical protein [Lawsonia intracellularis]CAJ55096.1 NA [Lawsonia intracellularis PHE/MN1-00]
MRGVTSRISNSSSTQHIVETHFKETNTDSSSQFGQTKMNSSGTRRIILAALTLGISEAVRAISSYCTKSSEHQGAQVAEKESPRLRAREGTPLNEAARRHNYGVIHSTIDPKQDSPFPEAIQNAMVSAQEYLKPIVTPGHEDILTRSLTTLQMRLHEIPEPFTSQSFELELTKEIKLTILKNSFSDSLIQELQQRKVPPQPEFISQLRTIETPVLTNISNMPKEEIPEAMNKLILKSAATIHNAHNSKQAREESLSIYQHVITSRYNISEQEAKKDNGYKMLETRLMECSTELQDAEKAKHPEYPVVPLRTYQEAFIEVTAPFLAIFGVTETKF